MSVVIALAALGLLIVAAYRGGSVILFAPLAAMLAVLLTDPGAVPAIFSGLFMERMASFLKSYFPVFLLGALFGKFIEVSGYAATLVSAVRRIVGPTRAIAAIVLVCALLTYGGVSVFVVAFAAYPFAAEMFRQADIPKRLIPATIALGAFTFTMDALPGTPQIQNIIPTTFFGTTTWAAPVLGVVGAVFILSAGLFYLEAARVRAGRKGEGYGEGHINEPAPVRDVDVSPVIAFLPLLVVGLANLALTWAIPVWFPSQLVTQISPGSAAITTDVKSVTAIWAVEGALLTGIGLLFALSFRRIVRAFNEQSKAATAGALLASLNTASEYGFGAVIALLPGFRVIQSALESIPNPLVNEAVTITALAGVTGSASGGLSIALGAMGQRFLQVATTAGLPPEVLHRVASMASGGMDTLPHNGAVITLLAVTGLTHRQSYPDIFALTLIKSAAVGVVILVYHFTGLV
ncbi:MAG: GntP family permease [Planctomycetaceae bacterium]